MSDTRKCQTCGNDGDWHATNLTMHRFNPGGEGNRFEVPKLSEVRSRPATPIDPVLRQALIDKGVLTPQDLRDAEAKVSAVTGQFHTDMKGTSDDGEQQGG